MMTDNEIISLAQQLVFSYGFNRRQEHPAMIYWTSFSGKLENNIRTKYPGWENWKHGLTINDKPFIELFPKESLVYLTADSPNIITTLVESDIYIIGGIVDHNRLKRITMNKAEELGVRTARFPFENYTIMESRKVITVNQVVELILRYLHTNSWEDSITNTLPKRKKAQLIDHSEEEGPTDITLPSEITPLNSDTHQPDSIPISTEEQKNTESLTLSSKTDHQKEDEKKFD